MILPLLVPLLFAASTNGLQDGYRAVNERCILAGYNTSYIKNPTLGLTLYNRTTRVFNGSAYMIKDLGMNVRASCQMYKFASNEYRLFPAIITTDVCKELGRNNVFGLSDIKNYSNIKTCPIRKGFYYVRNFEPDYRKYPPFVPKGSYKAEIKFYDNDNYVFELHWYGRFEDIMRWT